MTTSNRVAYLVSKDRAAGSCLEGRGAGGPTKGVSTPSPERTENGDGLCTK